MLPGGDRVVTHADRRIHRREGCPVVVIPRGDRAGGKGVPGQILTNFLTQVFKTSRQPGNTY
jgi:hypothetical protein